MRKFYGAAPLLAAAGFILSFSGAVAQDEGASANETPLSYVEDDKQIYLPGYFSRFSPQTAADMLFNIPGFSVQQGDDRRGFGQGGINVLINGARVSGKSTNPISILRQTSAESVIRIEIVEGATLGISGLSGQVANVVIDQEKTTGNWEWNGQFRKGLKSRILDGSVSMSGKVGDISYTWGLENNSNRNGAWGDELVTGPDGELIERRYQVIEGNVDGPEASLTLGHKDAAGREANFNAKLGLFFFDGSIRTEQYPTDPMDPDIFLLTLDEEDEWNSEIGGDYAFDALGGRLKLIGFNYLEHSEYSQNYTGADVDDEFVFGNRYEQITDEGEAILRAEQVWDRGEGRQLEIAGEVAYNFVDNEAALFELAEDGARTDIPLPGADGKVEEKRAEISAAYNFPLGEKLSVQASVAGEYSQLEQSGEFSNKRSFTRPKGFVAATYKLAEKTELRGRIERRVGQLEFGAFTSSVNLESQNEQVGNIDLVPEQSWYYQTAFEKTFDDDSKFTISLDYERLEDVVQQIPINGGDGPGNVPEATRTRLSLSGTQMLKNWGIDGGEMNYELMVRDSEIEDPFSGETRRLNGETKWYYRFEYRHDIPDTPYAYGASIEDFELAESYRRSQITLFDQSKPTIEIYGEHKDVFGATLQVYAYDLLNYTEDFRRDLYAGARPDAPFLYREQNNMAFDIIIGANLSGTF